MPGGRKGKGGRGRVPRWKRRKQAKDRETQQAGPPTGVDLTGDDSLGGGGGGGDGSGRGKGTARHGGGRRLCDRAHEQHGRRVSSASAVSGGRVKGGAAGRGRFAEPARARTLRGESPAFAEMYELGRSFDRECECFKPRVKAMARRVLAGGCGRCGRDATEHALRLAGGGVGRAAAHEQLWLAQAFAETRNARCRVACGCRVRTVAQSLRLCQKTLHGTVLSTNYRGRPWPEDARVALSDAMQQAVQYLRSVSADSAMDEDPEAQVESLIRVDEVAYALWYGTVATCLDPSDRYGPLPSPAFYFAGGIGLDLTKAAAAAGEFHREFPDVGSVEEASRWEAADAWFQNQAAGATFEPVEGINPLLSLHRSRWRETCVYFGAGSPLSVVYGSDADCMEPTAARKGQTVTMKGIDPRAPSTLTKWRDAVRDWAARLYAFATPTASAVKILAKAAPLYEAGAGVGYWAALLQANGVDVTATDVAPPAWAAKRSTGVSTKRNEYHGQISGFTPLAKADASDMSAPGRSARSLLLCYPPPRSRMAYCSAIAYLQAGGRCICYVGEFSGDTGDSEFEKLLHSRLRLTELLPLANWGNTCSVLSVWCLPVGAGPPAPPSSPILASPAPPHVYACSSCGCTTAGVRRCRYSCALLFCSPGCCVRGRTKHRAILASKHLYLDLSKIHWANKTHFARLQIGWLGSVVTDNSATGSRQDNQPVKRVRDTLSGGVAKKTRLES